MMRDQRISKPELPMARERESAEFAGHDLVLEFKEHIKRIGRNIYIDDGYIDMLMVESACGINTSEMRWHEELLRVLWCSVMRVYGNSEQLGLGSGFPNHPHCFLARITFHSQAEEMANFQNGDNFGYRQDLDSVNCFLSAK
ncbi:hypothetical protein R1sor_016474 [Riccia sorocarpa]|uniref:Uncharacterized protein n=1 Tax=Riccia sorocarpa TaxID=122646 RepID=A0ABD3HF29_9MARC